MSVEAAIWFRGTIKCEYWPGVFDILAYAPLLYPSGMVNEFGSFIRSERSGLG
jgi:hypothetical protein